MATVNIGDAASLNDGESRKFEFKRDGVHFEGFVLRLNGDLFAYENRCKHHPLPLDYGDGRFFTPDGDYLVCSSHGALYEPATGKCVQGPCAGASLTPMPVSTVDGEIEIEVAETE